MLQRGPTLSNELCGRGIIIFAQPPHVIPQRVCTAHKHVQFSKPMGLLVTDPCAGLSVHVQAIGSDST